MLKRLLDLIGAGLGILMLSPLIISIAIAIRIDSSGDILFLQKRLGKDGTPFTMLKFRTMVQNAEQMEEGLFSYENDTRITRVGKILRLTSLDELPQLFNVLHGSMSLVGPRPPVTYELGDYKDFTDHMKIRFEVNPGITGLAQISGRNQNSWDDKIIFDNKYVKVFAKWGILYDLVILLRTTYTVLSLNNTVESNPNDKDKSL